MGDAILVEHLRFAYPPVVQNSAQGASAPWRWVFDDLTLHMAEGEWLAVMGASDTGKTTLCLILAGLAPHLTGGKLEGRVVVGGRNVMDYPPPHLADTIGILFQEPEAQLFNPTVEAEVAWGLENLGLPAAEIRARVAAALNLVKLERAAQRAPAELSGGEKKRLALASVLAMRPPIFILDEPMGGLDPMGRRQLLDALAHLSARDGGPRATVVMAESDPEAVAAFADRVVVLHQGRIAADGTPRDLFHSGESLAAMGIAAPQMAQVASRLNRRLGTAFDFVTVEEAVSPLAAYLG